MLRTFASNNDGFSKINRQDATRGEVKAMLIKRRRMFKQIIDQDPSTNISVVRRGIWILKDSYLVDSLLEAIQAQSKKYFLRTLP
ncbi:hypothetical protein SAMN05421868_14716 [Paenibacillus naphthalenovorans]|nr:hypothetical protein SAMN05421868_14716 [Paenibacillus naphthalenovorans]